jgi:hypothetical protein
MMMIMICFFKRLWSCRVEFGAVAETLITFAMCFLLQCRAAWEEVLPNMKGVDTMSFSLNSKSQLHVSS